MFYKSLGGPKFNVLLGFNTVEGFLFDVSYKYKCVSINRYIRNKGISEEQYASDSGVKESIYWKRYLLFLTALQVITFLYKVLLFPFIVLDVILKLVYSILSISFENNSIIFSVLRLLKAKESYLAEIEEVVDEISYGLDPGALKQWQRRMYLREIPQLILDKVTNAVLKFFRLS